MAGFAELLTQQASQSIAQQKSPAQGFMQGAQLALQREQLQLQRKQLEQTQQQAQEAKVGKFNDALFKATNLKDHKARNAYLRKVMPRMRDTWGLSEMISDEALENLTVSEENLGRYAALQLAVRSGEMKHTEALAIANDPTRLADVTPVPLEMLSEDATDLTDAQERFLERQIKERAEAGRMQRAQMSKTDSSTKEFSRRAVEMRKELTSEIQPMKAAEREFTQAQNTMQDMMARVKRGEKLTNADANKMQALLSNISRTALNYQGRIPVTDTERMASRYGMGGRIKDVAEWIASRPIDNDRVRLMADFVDDGYRALQSAMQNTLDSYDEALRATPELAGDVDRARQMTRISAMREQLGFKDEAPADDAKKAPGTSSEPKLQGPSGKPLPDPRQGPVAQRILRDVNKAPDSLKALRQVARMYGMSLDDFSELLEQSAGARGGK